MFKILFLLAVFAVLLSVSSAQAALDLYAPALLFEMSAVHLVPIGGGAVDMSILTFHESSQNWVLFFRHAVDDVAPYDNFSVTVECNGASPVTFETTEYSQWVDEGVFSIEFPYQSSSYAVTYNQRVFTAKYSRCAVTVSDFGAGSYINNSDYGSLDVEMIPYLATLEFVDCSSAESSELSTIGELSSVVTIMTEVWNLAWLVYSIVIVIFAVFMIPILIFILIRWAIFRLTGFKLVERRDSGAINT